MNKIVVLFFVLASVSSKSLIIPENQDALSTSTDVEKLIRPILEEPDVFPENRTHHLFVGQCRETDQLLHAETIIINNDGTSKAAGDIKIKVEGPVFITCVTITDNLDKDGLSGAYPSYLAGGVGHSYIIIGFKTAYGYGAKFYVEVYGTEAKEMFT